MLGYKIGILLVLTLFSSSLYSQSFAEEIFIEFDKLEYDTGDTLTLTGSILDFSMPMVAVSIYDPDGKILSANNIDLDEEGNFLKTISLDSPFYDKPGIYTIEINYRQTTLEDFFIISGEFSDPEPIFVEEIKPEIVLLTTDKEVYTDGDTITINGIVSSLESPTVLIGIYDTFGTPAGFYFGDIDNNLEFSTSFLVKAGVNFKVDGEYSIKAHYAESEATAYFEFYEKITQHNDDKESPKTNPTDNKESPKTNPTDNKESPKTNPTDNKESPKTNPTDNNKSAKKDSSNSNPKVSNENELIIGNKEKEKSETSQKSPTEYDNLSVEDIELGKLLNQINLECDRSKYSDTISYYDGMGPALYRLCNYESSIQAFSESLLKDPNNVEILSNKGSALRKLGYFNDAILQYDRAIEINPNFLPAKNNKANVLANQGKYEEAISIYTEILSKNPNYFAARQNLELALSELPQKTINSIPLTDLLDTNSNPPSKIFTTENKQQTKPLNEKNSDFFEQLGGVFSSFGSLFGILN